MIFKLIKKLESGVRVGKIETAHGTIHTPAFMPVATVGSVKSLSPDELISLGAEIILSNTYHLYLRPGEKNIKKLGGLHKFMNWSGPILTDSGGYQVFSLGDRGVKKKSLVKISEEGVEFTSHLDGTKHMFTPEKVIQIQLDLGVDILMPLDYCPSGKATPAEVKQAVEITISWAKRSKKYFDRKLKEKNYRLKTNPPAGGLTTNPPALFGIVQGGLDLKLRKYCAEELIKLNFDGYSIGGLAVDHETRNMWKTVKQMGEILPENKPRYLMGVGTPNDIILATHLGMDMFDCVLPTRLARHGSVYLKTQNSKLKTTTQNLKTSRCYSEYIRQTQCKLREGFQQYDNLAIQQLSNYKLINLLNSKFRTDNSAIDNNCQCPACASGFSRAYISHLIRANEILGLRLATLHNLHQYLNLMREIRK